MVCDLPISGSVSFHLTDPMSCGGLTASRSLTLDDASASLVRLASSPV